MVEAGHASKGFRAGHSAPYLPNELGVKQEKRCACRSELFALVTCQSKEPKNVLYSLGAPGRRMVRLR
ncbi:MAG: hypothetical protein H0X40_06810 [Chthoniobacterales bacterium]|nr:hypothetical protein [Chthoniobacterales bacterium]